MYNCLCAGLLPCPLGAGETLDETPDDLRGKETHRARLAAHTFLPHLRGAASSTKTLAPEGRMRERATLSFRKESRTHRDNSIPRNSLEQHIPRSQAPIPCTLYPLPYPFTLSPVPLTLSLYSIPCTCDHIPATSLSSSILALKARGRTIDERAEKASGRALSSSRRRRPPTYLCERDVWGLDA